MTWHIRSLLFLNIDILSGNRQIQVQVICGIFINSVTNIFFKLFLIYCFFFFSFVYLTNSCIINQCTCPVKRTSKITQDSHRAFFIWSLLFDVVKVHVIALSASGGEHFSKDNTYRVTC